MGIVVHHQPANNSVSWNIHVWQAAWDGNLKLDQKGTTNGNVVDFELPDSPDPRKLQFKFYDTSWEPDDYIRRLFLISPTEVWTFDSSPRVIYQNPLPSGVIFNPGEVLTFQVITQSAFRGGRIYAWNPYAPNVPSAYFAESARDDANSVSTFRVTLQSWMTSGFNLKLMQPAGNNQAEVWEPNSSNRVWRPCDGASLWLKSGQCDVRSQPLALTPTALEVLYGAALSSPPPLVLQDLVEGSTFPMASSSTRTYPGSPLFNVATYDVPIYPEASYALTTQPNFENPPLQRPYPADPSSLSATSRFVLGAGSWLSAFPSITLLLPFYPNPNSRRASPRVYRFKFRPATVPFTKPYPQSSKRTERGRRR